MCHSKALTQANPIWGWQMLNHIRPMECVPTSVTAALTVGIAESSARVAQDPEAVGGEGPGLQVCAAAWRRALLVLTPSAPPLSPLSQALGSASHQGCSYFFPLYP